MTNDSELHAPVPPELGELVGEYGIHDDSEAVAICYGSAIRRRSRVADLDILIVEAAPGLSTRQQSFVSSFVELHRRTGRTLDAEVPYENKIFYTLEEVESAFALNMFRTQSNDPQIRILEDMTDDDPYFASPEMKLRLCLNAFTSSHLFFAGNELQYMSLKMKSYFALRNLVGMLASREGIEEVNYDTARALLLGPTTVAYKDYLGYEPSDQQFLENIRVALGIKIPDQHQNV